MMDTLVAEAAARGIKTIVGYYYPTKNAMVREFAQFVQATAEDADGNTTWRSRRLRAEAPPLRKFRTLIENGKRYETNHPAKAAAALFVLLTAAAGGCGFSAGG